MYITMATARLNYFTQGTEFIIVINKIVPRKRSHASSEMGRQSRGNEIGTE